MDLYRGNYTIRRGEERKQIKVAFKAESLVSAESLGKAACWEQYPPEDGWVIIKGSTSDWDPHKRGMSGLTLGFLLAEPAEEGQEPHTAKIYETVATSGLNTFWFLISNGGPSTLGLITAEDEYTARKLLFGYWHQPSVIKLRILSAVLETEAHKAYAASNLYSSVTAWVNDNSPFADEGWDCWFGWYNKQ